MPFRFVIGVTSWLLSSVSFATTWTPTTVEDPIGGGECEVHEPASYGSYIYEWPSKFDGVYWPFTDHHWLWQCDDSGYISFGNDFGTLTDGEVARIRDYLNKPTSRSGGDLERLESIYRLRDKDERFWAWFYRVKAAILSGQADQARHKALPLLEEVAGNLDPGFELIQIYFVIGDYHRRFGDVESAKKYFAKAQAIEWEDGEGNSQVGSEYINALIDERVALFPTPD